MRLKEIMSTQVESVRPAETLTHARGRLHLRGIHHLVVIDRGQVVGVITSDLLEARAADGVARVEDAMCRHFVTATPETTVRQAANLMRGRSEGALPVTDSGKLVGIVTVSDLLDVLGRGVDRPSPSKRATLQHRGVVPQPRPSPARRAL